MKQHGFFLRSRNTTFRKNPPFTTVGLVPYIIHVLRQQKQYLQIVIFYQWTKVLWSNISNTKLKLLVLYLKSREAHMKKRVSGRLTGKLDRTNANN